MPLNLRDGCKLEFDINNADIFESSCRTLYKKMFSVLQKCQYISNLKCIDDNIPFMHMGGVYNYLREEDNYLPKSPSYFAFDLKVKNVSTIYDKLQKNLPEVDSVRVYYNGCIFLIRANGGARSNHFLGFQVREILKQALACDAWEPITMAPCPVHISYAVGTSGEYLDDIKNNDFVSCVTITEEEFRNIDTFLQYFLFNISLFWERFITNTSMNQKNIRTCSDIENNIDELTEHVDKMINLESYDLTEKLNCMKSAQKLMCKFQKLSNEHSKEVAFLKEAKNEIVETGRMFEIDDKSIRYAKNHWLKNVINIEDRHQTIKFIQSLISTGYTTYSTIIASLLGVIIGAIIAKALK